MAEEFQSGICSNNWWNAARSGFNGSGMAASVSCSTAISEITAGYEWAGTEMVEGKVRSCDESAASISGSSVTFQDTHKAQASDQMLDSTLQMAGFGLSSPAMDWSQALISSNGRGESFHTMLQEDMSSRPYFRQEMATESDLAHAGTEGSFANPYKEMNQGYLVDEQQLKSGNESGFTLVPASHGLLQGLLQPDLKLQNSIYDNQTMNYQFPMTYRASSNEFLQSSWAKFPQFLKGSPPKQQQTNQLQFSNNAPFWNASAATVNEERTCFYPLPHAQFGTQVFEDKPNCSNISMKSNSEGVRDSGGATKKTGTEPAFKKPRIETPSPLPTFKVRKEKLGDRITALQQLVSPFGKTDTASVLQEAIDYIKFLHSQVGDLSSPYMKNGLPMQHQQNSDKSKDGDGLKQDLRSRGLCLVPISSTFMVASESTSDFWIPTFGGTYR